MAEEVTRLLDAARRGERGATERLYTEVYGELRRLARARLAGERSPEAPQPTSLVHEAWMRLSHGEAIDWKSRAYFFAAAAEAMRRVLVDQARERAAQKRGGDLQRLSLHDGQAAGGPDADDLIAIDRAFERLQERDARMADVAKLRYFAGLTVAETAEALEVPPRSVDRLWAAARAWLQRETRRS